MAKKSWLLAGRGLVLGASLSWARAADAPQPARVFEIRTYYTLPGRLDALHKRFREHTMKIFEKHGMTNVAYWTFAGQSREGIDADLRDLACQPGAGEEELGGIQHRSRVEGRWRQRREADGKIVEKVESVFVDATDYSPMK